MSASADSAAARNPFSARCVRPGAIPYQFPPGRNAAALIRRLRKNGWRGQVIGPHGSGKSALLATLMAAVETAGRQTVLIELHDRERRLPVNLRRMSGLTDETIVIVDGYEQLSRWSRFLLKRFCRRRGLGLVVTAHASVGFPDLFRTTTTLPLAQDIVHRLVGQGPSPVTAQELNRRFALHQGNLREVFFDLYDLYEQTRPKASAGNDVTEG